MIRPLITLRTYPRRKRKIPWGDLLTGVGIVIFGTMVFYAIAYCWTH